MRETAASRGVTLTSRSRPLRHEDLTTFDYILGMDFENMANIQLAADHWADRHDIPNNYRDKVQHSCKLYASRCAVLAALVMRCLPAKVQGHD